MFEIGLCLLCEKLCRKENVWDWIGFTLRNYFVANFGSLTVCRFTHYNTRLARLRILWWIHVYFSQEILSLKENNRFRTSQPCQARERCKLVESNWVNNNNLYNIKSIFLNTSPLFCLKYEIIDEKGWWNCAKKILCRKKLLKIECEKRYGKP